MDCLWLSKWKKKQKNTQDVKCCCMGSHYIGAKES